MIYHPNCTLLRVKGVLLIIILRVTGITWEILTKPGHTLTLFINFFLYIVFLWVPILADLLSELEICESRPGYYTLSI